MRSRCGCLPFCSNIGLIRSLKLALLSGMLWSVGCVFETSVPDHAGAVYDEANRGKSGQFVVAGAKGSGHATLPSEMKLWASKEEGYDHLPVLEWTYRYKWVGTDGKTHSSEWKSLGAKPDGSAVCDLTIRPSEVPELGDNWDHCVCETWATYKVGSLKRTQRLPIAVLAVPGG